MSTTFIDPTLYGKLLEGSQQVVTYQNTETDIYVRQQITEEQFQRINQILGRPPERFKSWANYFVFTFAPKKDPTPLLAYLQAQDIRHSFQMAFLWDTTSGLHFTALGDTCGAHNIPEDATEYEREIIQHVVSAYGFLMEEDWSYTPGELANRIAEVYDCIHNPQNAEMFRVLTGLDGR